MKKSRNIICISIIVLCLIVIAIVIFDWAGVDWISYLRQGRGNAA